MPTQKPYSSEKEIKEIWKLFRESDRKFSETKKLIEAESIKTDRKIQETAQQMKETDRRLKYLDDLFNGQWGKLMEALVDGDLVKLLKKRNIQVDHTHTNRKGKDYEFDIVAVNGDEVVVVEVKTTLKVKDVDYFKTKIDRFTDLCSEYKGKKIYGAVAYLKADQSSNTYAERQGFFVIRATGSSASITNPQDFKPKIFCSS